MHASSLTVNNHAIEVVKTDAGFYRLYLGDTLLNMARLLPAQPTAKGAYETLLALGKLPEYQFTERDFRHIVEETTNGRYGSFTTTWGQALSKADLGNARKFAKGFHKDMLGYLACFRDTHPVPADEFTYSVLDTPAYATR